MEKIKALDSTLPMLTEGYPYFLNKFRDKKSNALETRIFWPERFEKWDESPYNFIPQGGGDYHQNHRCPGEWITIDLMKIAVDMLVNQMKFSFPEQDTSISLTRIPAIPESRIIISDVRKAVPAQ